MESTNTKISQPGPEDKRLIFRNLSDDQKQKLLTGGAGAIGAFAGAGIFELLGTSLVLSESTAIAEPAVNEDILHSEPVTVYTEAPFAESVDDDMSFSEAFATARGETGPGGFFEWHGNTYNTYYREEWDQMGSGDQADYMASVYDQTHFDNVAEAGDTPSVEFIQAQESQVDTDKNVANNDGTESEMEVILVDRDDNGYADAVFIDVDKDGMIDVISIDRDFDGRADIYVVDLDDDGILDSMVVDDDQDGIQGDEIVIPLEKGVSLSIDQLNDRLNEDFDGLASDDMDDFDFPEDGPDDLMML